MDFWSRGDIHAPKESDNISEIVHHGKASGNHGNIFSLPLGNGENLSPQPTFQRLMYSPFRMKVFSMSSVLSVLTDNHLVILTIIISSILLVNWD